MKIKRIFRLITAIALLMIAATSCEKQKLGEPSRIVSLGDTFTIDIPCSDCYFNYWLDKGREGKVDSIKRECIDVDSISWKKEDVWTFIGKKKGKEGLTFQVEGGVRCIIVQIK